MARAVLPLKTLQARFLEHCNREAHKPFQLTRRQLLQGSGLALPSLTLTACNDEGANRLSLRRVAGGLLLLLDGVECFALRKGDFEQSPTISGSLSESRLRLQTKGGRFAGTDIPGDSYLKATLIRGRWRARLALKGLKLTVTGDLIDWLRGGLMTGRALPGQLVFGPGSALLIGGTNSATIDRHFAVAVDGHAKLLHRESRLVARRLEFKSGRRENSHDRPRSRLTLSLAAQKAELPALRELPPRVRAVTADIRLERLVLEAWRATDQTRRLQATVEGAGGALALYGEGASQTRPSQIELGKFQHTSLTSEGREESHLIAEFAPAGALLKSAGLNLRLGEASGDAGVSISNVAGKLTRFVCTAPLTSLEIPLGDYVVQHVEIPRDARVGVWFDWPGIPPPNEWCTLHLNHEGEDALRVPNFTTSLVRSQDLLLLGFDFVGVEVREKHGIPHVFPRLKMPAFMRVHFPPQHVAEVDLGWNDQAGDTSIPSPTNTHAPPEPKPSPLLRVLTSELAPPSRLVFKLPAFEGFKGIPLTVESLLDWSGFQLSVNKRAPPATDARAPSLPSYWQALATKPAGGVALPGEYECAVHVPATLILSPHLWSTWHHSTAPVSSTARISSTPRIELWHTRLSPFVADSIDQRTGTPRSRFDVSNPKDSAFHEDLRTVRALSPNPMSAPPQPPVAKDWSWYPFLPDATDANDIARLSSSYIMKLQECSGPRVDYDPSPIEYSRLHLSALGASAGLRAHWPTGVYDENGNPIVTVGYTHEMTTGRDNNAAVSILGFSVWTGHEMLLVRSRPREDVPDESGGRTAALRRRFHCTATKKVMEYAIPDDGVRFLGRRTPFRRVELEPAETTYLSVPIDLLTGQPSDRPSAFWMIPEGAPKNKPFEFRIKAQDWHGKNVEFSMPLLWVRGDLAARVFNMSPGGDEKLNSDLVKIINNFYLDDTYKPWRTATLHAQKVNVIEQIANESRDHSLEVEELTFEVETLNTTDFDNDVRWPDACHWPSQFYPAAETILARTGSTARLGSDTALQAYQYNGWYAAYGFPTLSGSPTYKSTKINAGLLYLDIVPYKEKPGIRFPPEKAGGMAQPSLKLRHLSLTGPIGGETPDCTKPIHYAPKSKVGSVAPLVSAGARLTAGSYIDSKAAQGILDPLDTFTPDMMLFGAIRFSDICRSIDGFQEIADCVPRLEEQYRQAVSAIISSVEQVRAKYDQLKQIAGQVTDAVKNFPNHLSDGNNAVRALVGSEISSLKADLAAQFSSIATNFAGEVDGALSALNAVYDAADVAGYEARLRWAAEDANILRSALRLEPTFNGFNQNLTAALDAISALGTSGFPFQRYRDVSKAFGDALGQVAAAFSSPEHLPAALANLQRTVQDIQGLILDTNALEAERSALQKATANTLAALQAFPLTVSALDSEFLGVQSAAKLAWDAHAFPPGGGPTDPKTIFRESRDKVWGDASNIVTTYRGKIDQIHSLTATIEVAQKAINGGLDQLNSTIDGLITDAGSQLDSLKEKLRRAVEPLLEVVEDAIDQIPQSVDLTYGFEPRLQDGMGGVFVASREGAPASLRLDVRITQDLRTAQKGPDFDFQSRLSDCTIIIPPSSPFISVGIDHVNYHAKSGARSTVELKLGKIQFVGQLDFVAALESLLSSDNGPYMQIDAAAVVAGFKVPIPAITSGAFSLVDVVINAEVRLPLDGSPMVTRAAASSRDKPAVVAFGIYGGTLFAAVESAPSHAVLIEGAIDGGLVAVFDFAGAHGCATATVGIYFQLQSGSARLTGYFRAHGTFDVYGLITINIDFYLGLTYEIGGSAYGECRISVQIGHGIFSFTVHVTATRHIAGNSSARKAYGLISGAAPANTTYVGSFRLGTAAETQWLLEEARYGSWAREPGYG